MNHDPYTPPGALVGERVSPEQTELRLPRGGWLTAVLVIMFVATCLTLVGYLLVVVGKLELPGRAPWVAQLLLLLATVNALCLLAIWNWRKWGLYVMVGTSIVVFALNISLGHGFLKATMGLLGLVLLLAAAYPKRNHFK